MFMTKTGRTKLLAKHHTGKIRPHKHTSYGGLALVTIMAVVPLFALSHSVVMAAEDDPVTGGYGTYAVVEGPVPKVAPTIGNINSGHVYTTSDPLTVRGSCPPDTMVKLFKNEVLAGAALCQSGAYETTIDLFVGNNSLIARAYNANDAVSPDSTPISVQLLLPGTQLNGTEQLNVQGAPAGQFYMTSQIFHHGVAAGDTASWPLIIAGGQAPYAVSVSWGDGKTDLYSRGEAGQFNINHAYKKPSDGYRGSYTIVIKSTDQLGSNSYLQLVAIVSSDQPATSVVGTIAKGSDKSLPVKVAWQTMAGVGILIIGFWLGERRELRVLKRTQGAV